MSGRNRPNATWRQVRSAAKLLFALCACFVSALSSTVQKPEVEKYRYDSIPGLEDGVKKMTQRLADTRQEAESARADFAEAKRLAEGLEKKLDRASDAEREQLGARLEAQKLRVLDAEIRLSRQAEKVDGVMGRLKDVQELRDLAVQIAELGLQKTREKSKARLMENEFAAHRQGLVDSEVKLRAARRLAAFTSGPKMASVAKARSRVNAKLKNAPKSGQSEVKQVMTDALNRVSRLENETKLARLDWDKLRSQLASARMSSWRSRFLMSNA